MAKQYNITKDAALAALKANGWVVRRTAKEIGIPETTLRRWAKEAGGPKKDDGLQGITDAQLALHLRRLAERIIYVLLKENKIENAGPRDLGILLGIVLDKIENLVGVRMGEDSQLSALISAIRASRGGDKG